jgi:hypothetical protein
VNSPTAFDQRGTPYSRVVDGNGGDARIDMGAFESQGVPSFAPGDFNHDGSVDAADYITWRQNVGTPEEFQLWRGNFSNTEVPVNPAASGTTVGDTEQDTQVRNTVNNYAVDLAIDSFGSPIARYARTEGPSATLVTIAQSTQVTNDLLNVPERPSVAVPVYENCDASLSDSSNDGVITGIDQIFAALNGESAFSGLGNFVE